MASGTELQGVEQMLASIRSKISSGVMKMENQGLREVGEILAEAQREKVAVSSMNRQHIKDDIRVSGVRREDGLRYVLVGPGKKTGWRAHFLEFGTKNTPAQPFIYPALHENSASINEILASQFGRGMGEG